MFKFMVSLVVIVSILQCTLSSPIVDPGKYDNEIRSPTEKLSNEIEVSLKSASKSVEWMVQSVFQLTTSIVKEFAVSVGGYCLAALLRLELFSMAGGQHLFFPKMVSSALENEHRIIAIATYKMTKKLHAVEEIDRILTNVSEQVATDQFKTKHLLEQQEKLMKLLFEKLELLIKENPKLYKEYIYEKRQAEQQAYPPMGELLCKMSDFHQIDVKKLNERLSTPVIRSMLVTKQFVQTAAKHFSLLLSVSEFDRYSTARWMLEESASHLANKLDDIYKQAIEKTAENMNMEEDIEKTKEALFNRLVVLMELEPSLKSTLELSKESQKKYNYFDVSFLRTDIFPF